MLNTSKSRQVACSESKITSVFQISNQHAAERFLCNEN